MTDLTAQLIRALAADGPLARAWPGWQARAAQHRMALAVGERIAEGGLLLAQLPTGAGKTLAYLLPALLAGARAVVATSTHLLQRQLALAQVQPLAQALGRPVRVAVLKGRGRYVCLQRLQEAVQQGPRPGGLAEHASLRGWLAWAQSSVEGDLDELPSLEHETSLRARLSSTSESCLRQACPQWSQCHVERARQRAAQADVVVINHHLWLSELKAQRRGRSAGVPRSPVLVFDEAHALRELASHWHSERVEAESLARFWRDLDDLARGPARGSAPWAALALQGKRAQQALDRSLQLAGVRDGLQVWPLAEQASARELGVTLQATHAALVVAQGSDARLAALRERAVVIARVLQGVLLPDAEREAWVDWKDAGQWTLVRPGPTAQASSLLELATGASWGAHCVVHTSATLGDEPSLRGHCDALGLDPTPGGPVHVLPQDDPEPWPAAAWHVPVDLPEPAEPTHGTALAQCIARWVPGLAGHVLVLTTTRRAARAIAQALHGALPAAWRVLLAEAEGQRRVWTALQEDNPRRSPAVVVASGAFWRGLDVPGNHLQMVVVDKLPFVPPDDPWLQRRLDRARQAGLDPFQHIQLQDTALALRQAAGRLIRGPQDVGLFVLGDVRLRTRGYGPTLAAAMRQWRWLDDEASVQAWLEAQAITRASTTTMPSA